VGPSRIELADQPDLEAAHDEMLAQASPWNARRKDGLQGWSFGLKQVSGAR